MRTASDHAAVRLARLIRLILILLRCDGAFESTPKQRRRRAQSVVARNGTAVCPSAFVNAAA